MDNYYTAVAVAAARRHRRIEASRRHRVRPGIDQALEGVCQANRVMTNCVMADCVAAKERACAEMSDAAAAKERACAEMSMPSSPPPRPMPMPLLPRPRSGVSPPQRPSLPLTPPSWVPS